MEQYGIKMKKFLSQNGKTLIIFIAGIIGIAMLGFSSSEDETDTHGVASVSTLSDEEYCLELESKIKSLVTAITGDGECIVGITLENGNEYIYADQNKLDSDQTEDKAGDETTTKESHKSEQEYIIVEGKDGEQTALIVTEKKPGVRGVAIVANGINYNNEKQIYAAVSAMLGIPERKINISQKAG